MKIPAAGGQLLFAISCPQLSPNDDEGCSVTGHWRQIPTGKRNDGQVERCHVGRNDMAKLVSSDVPQSGDASGDFWGGSEDFPSHAGLVYCLLIPIPVQHPSYLAISAQSTLSNHSTMCYDSTGLVSTQCGQSCKTIDHRVLYESSFAPTDIRAESEIHLESSIKPPESHSGNPPTARRHQPPLPLISSATPSSL